jgi:hypothetical protein
MHTYYWYYVLSYIECLWRLEGNPEVRVLIISSGWLLGNRPFIGQSVLLIHPSCFAPAAAAS